MEGGEERRDLRKNKGREITEEEADKKKNTGKLKQRTQTQMMRRKVPRRMLSF